MTVTGIASRYAQALVGALTAPQAGVDPHQALTGLADFVETLSGSRDLELVLLSPSVAPARKRAVLERIAGAMQMDRLVRNFLYVLVDHRRIELVREIVSEALVILDAQLGFLRADVASAAPLSSDQQKQIAAGLETVTGKRIRMAMTIDPDLIGGVFARVGSTIYDGSVRGRLQSLGERLGAS